MNDDERARLSAVESSVAELHRAFLEEEPDGSPPMIKRIGRLVAAAEQGEWAAKWMVRIILGLAAIVAAGGVILGAIKGVFPR